MASIQSVLYVDPFGPLPMGQNQSGVQATMDATGVPSTYVAYAQLLANSTPIAYGLGSTATAVRVFNQVPLALNLTYQIQVQFGSPGQQPANLNWQNPAILYSAPVIVQQVRITALTVTQTGLTFSWDVPGGASIAGVYLKVIDTTVGMVTQYLYVGTAPATPVAITYTSGHDYAVVVNGAQPINAGASGGFAGPYTIGPASAAQPIPISAPAITQVNFNAGDISARWTALAAPANAPTPNYELVLMSAGQIVSVAPAGPTGGQGISGQVAALSSPGIAARMRYGAFLGPVGSSAALLTLAPHIAGVAVTGSATAAVVTARLQAPGALPAGGALLATLYVNGVATQTQTLSSASGSVSWSPIAAAAGVVYAVDFALVTNVAGVLVQGPSSTRLSVPLFSPQLAYANYDGQFVTLGVTLGDMTADQYVVTLTAPGASTILTVGSQLPIRFQADLDMTTTWRATVQPKMGVVSALPASGPVSLPTLTAPTLTNVIYDGATLSLQWTAAILPYITGYQVSVSGGPGLITAANQTACVLHLTPSQVSGASVTVRGLSALRYSAASSAVPIISASVEFTSVVVGAQVVANWSVSGTAPAIRAELLIGDIVHSVLTGATLSAVTFPVPAPANQPFRLRAQPVSADGVAAGPYAQPVDLILSAPLLKSAYIADGRADLSWNPGNSFGVSAYQLSATPSTGAAASFMATGDGYRGPVPAAFGAPGALTITPTNPRCTGPLASVAIQAPADVISGSVGNGLLSVTAALGNGQANDLYWFDLMLNGGLISRQLATASGAPLTASVTFPTALAQGASATVRVIGIGPQTVSPASAPAPIPTVAPTVVRAAYDGARLHVFWTPSAVPGVDGYLVSIANGAPATTYVSGAQTGSVAITTTLAYPFASNIAVSVAAVNGAPNTTRYVIGPAGAAIAPTLAASLYCAAVAASGEPPYVYRRGAYQTLTSVSGEPIILFLANPFTAGTPTVPSTNAPIFQLKPAPGNPSLPYQLTISADAWTTLGATAVRTVLQQAYVQFLGALEAAGVYSWAIRLIQQLIAQAMPQTYPEVLYYRYGLWRDNSMRVVDLTPGMRLHLSNGFYDAIVGGASLKNGFYAAGADSMDIIDAIPQGGAGTIAAGAGSSLSVDAFLSLIYPGGGAAGNDQVVAAGPVDFFADNNRQPFYRLFYPPTPSSSSSNGTTALESNVTLIGSTSWQTLTAVTNQYAATGIFPTGLDYFALYFRGRSSLTPLINVTIQGDQRWVALGTSVRQALAAAGLAPYFGADAGDALTMLRATSNLYAYPAASAGLALNSVNLSNHDLGVFTPIYWPLDMPLVSGDQVALSPA